MEVITITYAKCLPRVISVGFQLSAAPLASLVRASWHWSSNGTNMVILVNGDETFWVALGVRCSNLRLWRWDPCRRASRLVVFKGETIRWEFSDSFATYWGDSVSVWLPSEQFDFCLMRIICIYIYICMSYCCKVKAYLWLVLNRTGCSIFRSVFDHRS